MTLKKAPDFIIHWSNKYKKTFRSFYILYQNAIRLLFNLVCNKEILCSSFPRDTVENLTYYIEGKVKEEVENKIQTLAKKKMIKIPQAGNKEIGYSNLLLVNWQNTFDS